MKALRIYIACVFWLASLTVSAQNNNAILDTTITFHADSISKKAILDSLSQLYDIHFSYNPDLIEAQKRISANWQEQNLSNILNSIIDSSVVIYQALDNQIVFSSVLLKECAEILKPFKILRGIVIDGKKHEPISYCNIGIKGKALGTMTNNNGEYILKIPKYLWSDTLIFSCIGYNNFSIALKNHNSELDTIILSSKLIQIKTVNVINYNPLKVLDSINENITKNYDNDNYSLFTTFYREIIQENNVYTDISEAVLQVMKVPYSIDYRNDCVKLLKGRKAAQEKPFTDVNLKLKGGPFYITKLDIVKNHESFINPKFRNVYNYEYKEQTLVDGHRCIVITFSPISTVRDILYQGKMFVDIETWAIVRVEFEYTRQGLREARNLLIQKEPKKCKAIPIDLAYTVQYKKIDGKWYFYNAQSLLEIKVNNKKKKEKTRFKSTSEILTTNIQKNTFKHFPRQDIFKSSEIFTDHIIGYDKNFWATYNIIQPEEELINALKKFDNTNLIITNQ